VAPGESEERVGLDTDELPRAKDAIGYIADKRLMRRLEGQVRRASRMVNEHSLPTWAGQLPFHLEPSDWRTGFLNVYEWNLSPEVHHNLKECLPQALLRDLFRPDFTTQWSPRELMFELDPGGVKALKDARDARKLDPVPYVPPMVNEVMHHKHAWRKIVGDRWLPFLDDNEPRKRVFIVRDPRLNW
jgi:hypothetical protein